jgi:hypothetical protein
MYDLERREGIRALFCMPRVCEGTVRRRVRRHDEQTDRRRRVLGSVWSNDSMVRALGVGHAGGSDVIKIKGLAEG